MSSPIMADHTILLQSHGSSGLTNWQITSRTGLTLNNLDHQAKRVYDKDLHGFCYIFNSNSVNLSYKANSSSLKHTFLVLQLFIPTDAQKILIELGTSDTIQSGPSSKYATKRRIFLSNLVKSVKSTPLHSNVPITQSFPRNQWTSLVIDLNNLTTALYKTSIFKHLDSIAIQGHKVKLRCVYTCKQINLSTFNTLQSSIPGSLAFPFTLKDQVAFVLLNSGTEMTLVSRNNLQDLNPLPSLLQQMNLDTAKKRKVPTLPTLSKPTAVSKLPPLTKLVPVKTIPNNKPSRQYSPPKLETPSTSRPNTSQIPQPPTHQPSKTSLMIPTYYKSMIPQPTTYKSITPQPSKTSMLPQPTQFHQHVPIDESGEDIDLLDLEVSQVVMKALNKAKLEQNQKVTYVKSPALSLKEVLQQQTVEQHSANSEADDSLVELTYDTSIGAYVDQLSGQCYQIDSY